MGRNMNVGCNDNPLVDVRTGARHADGRLGRNFRILRVCFIAVYTCLCIHTCIHTYVARITRLSPRTAGSSRTADNFDDQGRTPRAQRRVAAGDLVPDHDRASSCRLCPRAATTRRAFALSAPAGLHAAFRPAPSRQFLEPALVAHGVGRSGSRTGSGRAVRSLRSTTAIGIGVPRRAQKEGRQQGQEDGAC